MHYVTLTFTFFSHCPVVFIKSILFLVFHSTFHFRPVRFMSIAAIAFANKLFQDNLCNCNFNLSSFNQLIVLLLHGSCSFTHRSIDLPQLWQLITKPIWTEALRLNSLPHSFNFFHIQPFCAALSCGFEPSSNFQFHFLQFHLRTFYIDFSDSSLDIFYNSIRIQLQFQFLRSCVGARSIEPPHSKWSLAYRTSSDLDEFTIFSPDNFAGA